MRHRGEEEGPRAAGWAMRRAEARPSRPARPGFSRRTRVALGLGSVVLLGAVTWAARPLVPDPVVERLRAAKFPVTEAEMECRLAVPAAENAEGLMRTLAGHAKERPKGSIEAIPHDAVTLVLASLAPTYSRMAYDRDWSDAVATPFPELSSWKLAARALAEDAPMAAAEGDVPRLVADLTAGDALADLIAQEPSHFAALISVAISAITEKAAQDALRANPSPEIRAAVARFAASRRPLRPRARALMSEGLMMLTLSSDVSIARMADALTGAGEEAPPPREKVLPRFGSDATRVRWREEASPLLANLYQAALAAPVGRERAAMREALEWNADEYDGPNPLFLRSGWREFSDALPRPAASRALTDALLARLDGRPLPFDPYGRKERIAIEEMGGGRFRLRSRGPDGKLGAGPPLKDRKKDDDLLVSWPVQEVRR